MTSFPFEFSEGDFGYFYFCEKGNGDLDYSYKDRDKANGFYILWLDTGRLLRALHKMRSSRNPELEKCSWYNANNLDSSAVDLMVQPEWYWEVTYNPDSGNVVIINLCPEHRNINEVSSACFKFPLADIDEFIKLVESSWFHK